MKKKLFPVIVGLISAFFMVSCESEEPFTGGSENTSEVNSWIYKNIFTPNYLWDVTESPNWFLGPEEFFNSLKNPNDKVSTIQAVSASTSTRYSIGFEYGIIKYLNDEKTCYVVCYTVPESKAEKAGLVRGYIITQVNGVEPKDEEHAQTLLYNAYKDGRSVEFTYVIPPASNPRTAKVEPSKATEEDPLYLANTSLVSNGTMGYMLYNSFTPGENYMYDNAVATKFQQFMNAGINYLVLDLRYNAGGNLASSTVLASAMIKDRKVGDDFIVYERDRKSLEGVTPLSPEKIVENTRGGVSIPKLADQLKRIYVITGVTTSGTSEAFINSLRAYASEVKIVGMKSAGSGNISVSGVSGYNWNLSLAIAYMANKNGKYDYANGITPDIVVNEISTSETTFLKPLGSQEELVLYAIVQDIANNQTRSAITDNGGVQMLSTSMMNKPWANKAIIDLDELK